jgi:hypothetical protein
MEKDVKGASFLWSIGGNYLGVTQGITPLGEVASTVWKGNK